MKVLLLESIHATAHELFATEGFQVESVPGALSEDELCARVGKFDLIGIRSKTRLTARVLEAGKNLLGVGAFCIGTNQIDLETANRLGIPVFNSPFSNTRSVAELVISEIVALSRHLGDRSREIHEGKWRKTAAGSFEVRGKTVGIIGYGHIGSQVGVLAENMGMRVVSYDIRTTLPMGNNRAVGSLDELFDEADFVTLHVPETPETRMMIGKAELAAMKKGACLLNLSRGSVVDIAALADALKAKHIGGAAIDVYPEEPEGNTDDFKTPLQGLPNVILTPHIGGSTLEAQANIGREVGTSLIRLTNAGATTGAVNFPQIELPPKRETHRVLNVHKNVPGVLSDINKIVSEKSANIMGQVLSTDPNIGYLIMDLDKEVAGDVNTAIAALPASIKTRILY
ncbi:MAG: phosphoglycerate dehydrogenase [Myxococcales bacterium]|nr:phosphoglycerate dehydrogenase [Myxococcales bacterium]